MPISKSFEDILAALGASGRYQLCQYIWIFLSLLTTVFGILGYAFIGQSVPHQCAPLSEQSLNDVLADLGIPISDVTSNTSVQNECSIDVTVTTATTSETTTVDCLDGQDFGPPPFNSVVSEFSLVCDRALLSRLPQFFFIVVQIIGGVTIPIIADRLGRKPLFITAHAMSLILAVTLSFPRSIEFFIVVKALAGAFIEGLLLLTVAMTVELTKVNDRKLASLGLIVAWFTAGLTLGALSFGLRQESWRTLQYALAAGSGVVFVQIFVIEESIRWLFAVGRDKEAIALITKAARLNKVDIETVLGPNEPEKEDPSASTDEAIDVTFDDASGTSTESGADTLNHTTGDASGPSTEALSKPHEDTNSLAIEPADDTTPGKGHPASPNSTTDGTTTTGSSVMDVPSENTVVTSTYASDSPNESVTVSSPTEIAATNGTNAVPSPHDMASPNGTNVSSLNRLDAPNVNGTAASVSGTNVAASTSSSGTTVVAPQPETSIAVAYTEHSKPQRKHCFSSGKNKHLIVNTIIFIYLWLVMGFSYYALYFTGSVFSNDVYLNFTINVLSEVPAAFVIVFGVDSIGRKNVIFVFLGLAVVFLVCVSIITVFAVASLQSIILPIFGLIGKLGVAGAFFTLFLYTGETYPTNFRLLGLGISSVSGRVGSLGAPFLVLLSEDLAWLPTAIIAGLLLIGIFVTFPLPETKGKELPQSLDDVEDLYKT